MARTPLSRAPAGQRTLKLTVCLTALIWLVSVAPALCGVVDEPCPADAIPVLPGEPIQAAVDRAGAGAAFCLKNGVHRSQAVRPRANQRFYGEGRTILNGSRRLTDFSREGSYWIAGGQNQQGRRVGSCVRSMPACNVPEAVFIDDAPLVQVLTKNELTPGRFYFDHSIGEIFLADDPSAHKVEVTAAAFAFESTAPGVLIRNLIIEKYASVGQKGAIQAQDTNGWVVENCELRLNSAAGIAAGSGTRIRDCDIHHNGQIGITGAGHDVVIERNRVFENNTRGFSSNWEAGGVKLAVSSDVVLRGNLVYDNRGPGLWCDIECRDVLYEGNIIERNRDAGIFHEISFSAVIRNNRVRHNGLGKGWFWGNNILIAASQDVDVHDNALAVSAGKCGIILVDQGRRMKSGDLYKTRNNNIHDNDMTFEGAVCAGAASDVGPDNANANVIETGNNRFDSNVYRVSRGSARVRFAWGHAVFDWDELRRAGLEHNGSLLVY
ncbi:right-handed parallel beta-helix repeat-containing protein [Bradyrhizobium sp. ISRA443]|uniref:right-handed parallel beta-helix repeat-containing protein n=1 Tax=unclassified Bradyrhizobium TaxID=2631580 RepID=UPI00247A8511|nr:MULTISPECIES: right-handed parallel beta-helix repeat-containing protein [unclassified Bradyrhizobium]WGR91209.1 right-handed parallel beta-helix repeat-containing protein [Bradyrhizobium sp. ISRA435]WGS01420.1 right-handed parallel beta-helix repeat-containing protein [Bradyrhizobium sp. ISRA436]WGS08307.1 right-handed parallel beta-helix repeat-containing protein [Bradyrhizobium sp. ISRA437]WGS15195.1 right-handed parallel beta-helix repeat-containing protein [Bradyrhizobium sp. ISRA443]